MQPTNEQIERVAKWCLGNHPMRKHFRREQDGRWTYFYRTDIGDEIGNNGDPWIIVGIIAESAKAAGIGFHIEPSVVIDGGYWFAVDGAEAHSERVDFAAILAVDAYLVAKGESNAP